MRIQSSVLFYVCLLFASVCAQFHNPYPKIKSHTPKDNEDTGEPLFLTPLIEAGKISMAQNLSFVTHAKLDWIESHAGYFTVNKKYNSNMFFWFFRAQNDKDNAPVVLWLQGGPGASSLFGLFSENGPFSVTEDLDYPPRKYSWHMHHNLIYIDNPVGTGFSFTDNDLGYSTSETSVGENLYETMQQFFKLFPELRKNPFYITGESYAGKYIPALGYQIHHQNQVADNEVINLKGMAIGDGFSDPLHQLNYGDYLYQIGLIDDNAKNLFAKYQRSAEKLIENGDYTAAFLLMDRLIDGDNGQNSLFQNLTGLVQYYNYLSTLTDDGSAAMAKLIGNAEMRKAIHVGNLTFHGLDENKVGTFLIRDIMKSVALWIGELLSYYPIVFYSGQLDIIVAYPLTVNYLQQLDFKDHDQYLAAERRIWRVDGEIAGYVKEAGNLIEILVRDAGHMVPLDQPKWALDLLLHLTHGKHYSAQ
ncbi:venom serine carboxypeptidase-like [Phlebotomus argentipes]|uniref:venom serine carboxypeptidase-like n=1 Tax=Phlebotomus argentipes TaxID=94469 RepID=UPI002892A36D|nr:venom serine carboxypeptidase-like [Phlebotomus argentipes]